MLESPGHGNTGRLGTLQRVSIHLGICEGRMLELADVLYEVILTNCSLGFQLTNKIKCLWATLEWLLNLFYELLSALLDISYKTLQLCCVICRQKKR